MKKLLLLVMLLSTSSVFAGLLIEPYVGYMASSGEYEFPYTNGSKSTWDSTTSAAVIGGRLGYKAPLGLFLALDYSMYSSHKIKLERTGSTPFTYNSQNYDSLDFKASSTNIGLTAGIGIPFVRAWATYFVSSTIKVDEEPSPDFMQSGTEFSGNGFGLGVGLGFIPFISLNLEYRALSYDEETPGSSSYNYKVKPDSSELLVSVSLPLSI